MHLEAQGLKISTNHGVGKREGELQHVYSTELSQLVPLAFLQVRSTIDVTKDVYVNSFFPCTAILWNSLPIECFPLTYDLNVFKSRINKHLLTVGSF